ncbi:hypothetical protein [Thermosipho melanesiensis]|nr:hypothetical protein [Thermosipho melanesiensis]
MKILLLLVHFIPLISNSIKIPNQVICNFEIPYEVRNDLYKFLDEASLTLPTTPVSVYETTNLYEFNKTTGMPYSVGGIYKDFIIILQPRDVLIKKGVFYKVLTHELLHWVLYGLKEEYQEGLIYWWLKDYEKDEVDKFLDVFDGDLHKFIISNWKE